MEILIGVEMRFEFLRSEGVLQVLQIQFLCYCILFHFFDGFVAGYFLYILLGLIRQQTFPQLVPKDLVVVFEQSSVSLIDQCCQVLKFLLLDHAFEDIGLYFEVDVDDAFD